MKGLISTVLTLSFLTIPSLNINAEELDQRFWGYRKIENILYVDALKMGETPVTCEPFYDVDGDGLEDVSEVFEVGPAPDKNFLPVGNPFHCWKDGNKNKILDKGEVFIPISNASEYWFDKNKDHIKQPDEIWFDYAKDGINGNEINKEEMIRKEDLKKFF